MGIKPIPLVFNHITFSNFFYESSDCCFVIKSDSSAFVQNGIH
ncbi:Uncharacterised protein [Vibrio cholerae]|nr:Uncharacterised protein [Vibrio cholerae]